MHRHRPDSGRYRPGGWRAHRLRLALTLSGRPRHSGRGGDTGDVEPSGQGTSNPLALRNPGKPVDSGLKNLARELWQM